LTCYVVGGRRGIKQTTIKKSLFTVRRPEEWVEYFKAKNHELTTKRAHMAGPIKGTSNG
jgi:hypothetical protein